MYKFARLPKSAVPACHTQACVALGMSCGHATPWHVGRVPACRTQYPGMWAGYQHVTPSTQACGQGTSMSHPVPRHVGRVPACHTQYPGMWAGYQHVTPSTQACGQGTSMSHPGMCCPGHVTGMPVSFLVKDSISILTPRATSLSTGFMRLRLPLHWPISTT